jgi:hypothetical protein
VPLPWHRTYVLILPPGDTGFEGIAGADSAAFRAGLASEAVPVEARAAEGPYWWVAARCPALRATAQAVHRRSVAVLYARNDPVARALAERLVAMSRLADAVTRGVAPAELAGSLRPGSDRGYVIALPRRPLVPCRELAGWPAGATALALIDTRAHLILRDGVPPLLVEHDGAVRPLNGR